MSDESIAENFNRFFRVDIAQTKEQLEEVFRIRYRVYAEEFGFEKASDFPDQMETDEYDAQSVHCLVTHRERGPAACVRMVPTFNTEAQDPLPLEKYCGDCLDKDAIAAMNLSRESMCEISRLAVDGAFRQRRGEKKTRFGSPDVADPSKEELRIYPLIAVSAFLSMISISSLYGRPNTFMMTEPFLPRLMSRSGIVVEKIGSQINYHGVRSPYFVTSGKAADGLVPDLKELYLTIDDHLTDQYAALAKQAK